MDEHGEVDGVPRSARETRVTAKQRVLYEIEEIGTFGQTFEQRIERLLMTESSSDRATLAAIREAMERSRDALADARRSAHELAETWTPSPPPLQRPQRAWLAFYDPQVSGVTPADIVQTGRADRYISPVGWNVSRHTRAGDTLLIYARGDDAATTGLRWIARIETDPVAGDDARFARTQWWSELAHGIEVEPIAKAKIDAIAGERVNLQGGPHYVRPDVANALLELATIVTPDAGDRSEEPAFERVGRSDLPSPATIDLAGLRALAPSLLVAEGEVEVYRVEPLLRLLGVAPRRWGRRTPLGGGVADFAITHLTRAQFTCIIEAKREFSGLPKVLEQARRYAAGTPAGVMLVDAARVLAFRAGGAKPIVEVPFARLDEQALGRLRGVVEGEA